MNSVVWVGMLGAMAPTLYHWVTPSAAARTHQESVAFLNVNVIPMDEERLLTRQTVVVRGDRIVAMGATDAVAVPTNAQRIDGTGKFLIPGLVDMHPPHARLPSEDGVVDQFLAHGLTTLRIMGDVVDPVALKAKAAERHRRGPQILSAQYPEGCTANPQDASYGVQGLSRCFRERRARGIGEVKIYNSQHPEFDSIAAAARDAGVPVVGHVPEPVGLLPVLQVPYRSIEHTWGYLDHLLGFSGKVGLISTIWKMSDSARAAFADTAAWMKPAYQIDTARLRDVVRMTRLAGTWNVPTLAAIDQLATTTTGSKKQLVQRFIQLNLPIVKALHDEGAGLLLGTDEGAPGEWVERELAMLVRVGLTPYQALAAGTRNAAAYFAATDTMGTIAVGMRADLVLLAQNPLEDIRNVALTIGTMAEGQWLTRESLEVTSGKATP